MTRNWNDKEFFIILTQSKILHKENILFTFVQFPKIQAHQRDDRHQGLKRIVRIKSLFDHLFFKPQRVLEQGFVDLRSGYLSFEI